VAVTITASTVLGWLPAIAALVTIVWTCIRVYETKTVQALIARWRGRKPQE
jgi:uncharacterized membrane protein YesL